jgi:hypothetical protein
VIKGLIPDEDLIKLKGGQVASGRFARLRGVATVKMTTDEIMALTRQDK